MCVAPPGSWLASGAQVLEIVRPGLLATVQDGGRCGLGRFGVSPAGAMDVLALALANRLVGNDAGAPALELTGPGAELVFLDAVAFALCGGDLGATLAAAAAPAVRGRRPRRRAPGLLHHPGARVVLALAGGRRCRRWLAAPPRIRRRPRGRGGQAARPRPAPGRAPAERGRDSGRGGPAAGGGVRPAPPAALRARGGRGRAAAAAAAFTARAFRLSHALEPHRLPLRGRAAARAASSPSGSPRPTPPAPCSCRPTGCPSCSWPSATPPGATRASASPPWISRPPSSAPGHELRFVAVTLEEARALARAARPRSTTSRRRRAR